MCVCVCVYIDIDIDIDIDIYVCVCVYIYIPCFGLHSHLGHHRALGRVPCAIHQVLISYLFYTYQCLHISPSLPIYPTFLPPLRMCLYICLENRFIYSIFINSTHMC